MINSFIFDYSKTAEKFFAKHEDIRKEFKKCIARIINNDNPELVNFKNLKDKLKGYSRIAISGYRVIFTIINGEIIILRVISAGSRGDIYQHSVL